MAHWDTCILCDACSAICPAGVRMEPIGQSLRAAVGETKGYAHGRVMNALLRWALPNLEVLRAAVTLGGVYQRTGLGRLARSLRLEQALGLAELVEMLPPVESEPLVPAGQVWEPVGEHRATVALLAGCYMSAVFGETDRATARVLAANGCRVIVPAGQGCCGSLHAHRGELATAHKLAPPQHRCLRAGAGRCHRGERGGLRQHPEALRRLSLRRPLLRGEGCGLCRTRCETSPSS